MKTLFDSEQYSLYLQTHIKPWARPASGGRVINCRCFYCRDSSNKSHGHFYISIPQKESEPSVFYCHKCGVKGLVTNDKLLSWQIFDPDIAMMLMSYNNNSVFSSPRNAKFQNNTIYQIMNLIQYPDELTERKVIYLSERIGVNLTYKDCMEMKIVPDIIPLMTYNHLKPTRDERIINQLDNGFVGFLSYDNAFLSLRNIGVVKDLHPSIDKRYVNYNLVDKYDNTCRFYTVPTNIDILNPQPVQIHIAEGPVDILSIYYNLRNKNPHAVFSAAMGKGYKGLIRVILLTISIPFAEIHIYPDNDMDRDSVMDIADYIKDFKYPFYIHRNVYPGEKDFGVPLDKIKESIERII